MSEIYALTRLSITRNRWVLLVMTSVVILGVGVAIASRLIAPGDTGEMIATITLLLTLMPAAITTLILFDYGLDGDLNLPESACSHWLLRMPIDAWKIAIVPIILKTLWVIGLWVTFWLVIGRLSRDEIPIVLPCFAFSAIAIWVMVLSWRPFRSQYRRLGLLLVAAVALYCTVVGVFASANIDRIDWRTTAFVASAVSAVGMYFLGILTAIGSTRLARVSPGGVIPPEEPVRGAIWRRTLGLTEHANQKELVFATPLRALMHHDYLRCRIWLQGLVLLVMLPVILIFVFFVPFSLPSTIALLFLFSYISGAAVSHPFSSGELAGKIPPYVAASPLSNQTLAWKRQLFPLIVAIIAYCCVSIVFIGWASWESNRDAWMTWASDQAASLDRPEEALTIGVRLSIAAVLGAAIFYLGRVAAYVWVMLSGRNWVASTVVILGSLSLGVLVVACLRWFMVQTDWESTRTSAMSYLTYLPWIVGTLLVCKAALTVLVVIRSSHFNHVSLTQSAQIVIGWGLLVLGLGTIFFLLLPYSFATLPWCLALTALTVPIARILVMPMALAWNRHR